MNSKEKAKELVDKFMDRDLIDVNTDTYWLGIEASKQCALICSDESIKDWDSITSEDVSLQFIIERMEFWESVKREIEKL